jgi:hypothetical protein
MKRGYQVAALSLLLAAAFACGSDGPDDGRCGEEALAFSVTGGTHPTIGWSPNCTIAQMRIIHNETDTEVWAIVASSNSIEPGVVYGETPVGATETNPPESLFFNDTYTVRLAVLDPDENLLLVIGSVEFTPGL